MKIPLFPCGSETEGEILIRTIGTKRGLRIGAEPLRPLPALLTPGSVATIVEETIRRKEKCEGKTKDDALLRTVLKTYQDPNPEKTEALIQAAIEESSSKEFIPSSWKSPI